MTSLSESLICPLQKHPGKIETIREKAPAINRGAIAEVFMPIRMTRRDKTPDKVQAFDFGRTMAAVITAATMYYTYYTD